MLVCRCKFACKGAGAKCKGVCSCANANRKFASQVCRCKVQRGLQVRFCKVCKVIFGPMRRSDFYRRSNLET